MRKLLLESGHGIRRHSLLSGCVLLALGALVAGCGEGRGTGEPTSGGLACYNVLKAESNKATPDRAKIETACVSAIPMMNAHSSTADQTEGPDVNNGDGPDSNFIFWCDEVSCCVAQDSGPICCCWTDGTCGCG